MGQPFNVNEYWVVRGRNYRSEALPAEYHRLQEQFLLEILEDSRIPMDRILELGCGFGRVTKRLSEAFPRSKITALDLSLDQLQNAREFCRGQANITFEQFDFYSGKPLPGDGYDTAVAVEVLLHHPRPVVRSIFERLAGVSRHIVNVDWSEDWPWETPEHVWVHDFPSIYSDAGLRCATFALPRKIDSMQQKLFIASRSLEPYLVHLERQVQKGQKADSDSVEQKGEAQSEAQQWPRQLAKAVTELKQTLPAGTQFILVNDDLWGNEAKDFAGYRVWPFLEHEGQYWGPPADDRTALRELERLQQAGATHIAFAWSSFWWLEYFGGFSRALRSRGRALLENDRLIIFQL